MSINRELAKLGLVFGTIYFVQGMGGLPAIPIQYLLKNVLKLNEAQAQYFAAATSIAWLVKPLWGYFSDTFPIFGYRRKSYLIGMSLTAAASWFTLAWMASHNDYRYWGLLILFNISAAAYAFVDVVCDGLMVENGKRARLMDQFVNVQWFGMGLAGIAVGFLSGYLAEIANKHVEFYQYVFGVAGIVPICTAFVVLFLVREERIGAPFPWKKLFRVATVVGGIAAVSVLFLWGIIVPPVGIATTLAALFSSVGSKIFVLLIVFIAAAFFVWGWAGKPRFFWVMSFFLFLWGFRPSAGQARMYYQIDVLKFSESFFGFLSSLESVCWVLGILLYGYALKQFPGIGRKSYLYYSVGLGAIGSAFGYLYYLAPQTVMLGFGLNYFAVAIISAVFLTLFGMPSWLVPLSVAGDVSKSGNEAITYAWFMSVANFSNTMSSLTGGWLYQVLQGVDFSSLAWLVGTADFLGAHANKALILRLFIWVGVLFTLITIPLVFFTKIPERQKAPDQ